MYSSKQFVASRSELIIMFLGITLTAITTTATAIMIIFAWQNIPVPLNFNIIAIPWAISLSILGLWAFWRACGNSES
jgi:hypothetical protein